MTRNRHYGEIHDTDVFDEQITPDLTGQPKVGNFDPVGVSGVRRAAGIIDEEFLPALRGRKATKVYREMALNDPIVSALLFTFEQLLRQTEWTVEGASQEEEDQAAADFLESCMDDMSKSWGDTIAEVLSFLTYGWSWSEIVYKKRVGPWEKDPRRKSKYSDGHIGWRKIEIRAQETMMRWIFDPEGQVQAMVQMAPPRYQTRVIPIERSLLFRFRENKGSPEGISMLRGAYRPWFFKKRLEEFEAIGVERDLAGMPVAKIPASFMNAPVGSPDHKTYQAFKRMVRGIRRDEHEGIVMPISYDKDTKQPLFDFELMSSGGARQFDTSSIIERYEQRILMSVLADFIMVGHQGQGSYALHVDKTGIFRAALNAVAKHIADVFNRYAIPRLFAINGWKPDELPKIVPSNVDSPNLTELVGFMGQLAGMGMEWFPDPDLEKFLRKTSGLPDIPDDKLEMRRELAEQMDMMSYAETQMQAMDTKQKAELSAQGMSTQQAEMAMGGQDPGAGPPGQEEAGEHPQEDAQQPEGVVPEPMEEDPTQPVQAQDAPPEPVPPPVQEDDSQALPQPPVQPPEEQYQGEVPGIPPDILQRLGNPDPNPADKTLEERTESIPREEEVDEGPKESKAQFLARMRAQEAEGAKEEKANTKPSPDGAQDRIRRRELVDEQKAKIAQRRAEQKRDTEKAESKEEFLARMRREMGEEGQGR